MDQFKRMAIFAEVVAAGSMTAAARQLGMTPSAVSQRDGLTVVAAEAREAGQVAQAVAGHDAMISAFNPGWSQPRLYDLVLQGNQAIVDGVKASGVKRLLIVGCAGSLYVAPGVQLIDTPDFPAEFKQGGLAARIVLNRIRLETTLDWSFLSPPLNLTIGPRTGHYRLGADNLLTGQDGQPTDMSLSNLAVAVVDEIEQPRHAQRWFSVAH